MARAIEKLSPRRQEFVRQYIKDFNAKQAYIRAGYSPNGAEQSAHKVLMDAEVQAAVQEEVGHIVERHEISVDRVAEEVARMAFSNLGDYLDLQDDGTALVNLKKATRAQMAALSEITTKDGEVKIKLHSKTQAANFLGKYLKMLVDVQEHRFGEELESKLGAFYEKWRGEGE